MDQLAQRRHRVEQPTLFMFNLFLNAFGYQAITAENAAAGIEIFKKERPSATTRRTTAKPFGGSSKRVIFTAESLFL